MNYDIKLTLKLSLHTLAVCRGLNPEKESHLSVLKRLLTMFSQYLFLLVKGGLSLKTKNLHIYLYFIATKYI